MSIFHDNIPPLPDDQWVLGQKKLDTYHALTGNIVIHEMECHGRDPLYFVAHCRNGYEAEGEYFQTIGQARFRFEILKRKII